VAKTEKVKGIRHSVASKMTAPKKKNQEGGGRQEKAGVSIATLYGTGGKGRVTGRGAGEGDTSG